MANLPTPALRKKRILRDVCLLLLCPLVLLLAWGFPCFTRSQALWALQKANFFEGGRVVAWSSPPEDRDTAYAVLRRDGWYAVGTLRRAGPFWEPVRFNAVQPDDALPITLLFEDAGMAHSFLCVLSSDPQIVTRAGLRGGLLRNQLVPAAAAYPPAGGGGTLLSLSL